MAITEQLLTGSAVAESLDDIALLRITIFREFPYLYDGRREEESLYLQVYAKAPDTTILTMSDSGKIIGAATGIPLRHEHQELLEPFAGTVYPLDEIYYVGELLFYPEYRNRGLGMRLLARMEEQVRSMGSYRYLTCATVVRPDDHPLRPAAYLPINRFLTVAGFLPLSEIMTEFPWLETDGATRSHPMNFWIKELW
jgi:GNAT superfamily N-acetyltransferase